MFQEGELIRTNSADKVMSLEDGQLVKVLALQKDFHSQIADEGMEGLIMVTLPELYDDLKDLNPLEKFNIWFISGRNKKAWIYYEDCFESVVDNHQNKTALKKL